MSGSTKLALLFTIAPLFATLSAGQEVPNGTPNGTYVATAYAQSGTTASGITTKRHVIAADPDVLPIGSRIKVRHAGRYSGEYVVADTGRLIQGRRLDIYMPSEKACLKFGRKRVIVRVLQIGDGTHRTTTVAERQVKQDVQQDLAKKVVGNAATEDDWRAKTAQEKGSGTAEAEEGSSTVASSRGAGVSADTGSASVDTER